MFLCLRSSLRSKLALGVDSVTRNYVYALFVFAWPEAESTRRPKNSGKVLTFTDMVQRQLQLSGIHLT